MKLRLFLVFVIIYIIAVFGWWLYSFISYTKKEYQLEYNNLQLNALVIQNNIIKFIDLKNTEKLRSPYRAYSVYNKEILNLHADLNKRYKIKTRLEVSDTNSSLYNLVTVKIIESEFRVIEKNFIKKQRAFYSEVIFFTILIISGVIWVFGRLEALLNLNKMQNNFLLSVTHELKTPLTAIKLSSQTLLHRKIDEETRELLNRQIVNNSDRLNELLDNVLLATRIDGKSYTFNMSKINITELIHKSASLILSAPNFTGRFIFNEADKVITGDEISLQLVFSNLFQNAVKYAGPDSTIELNYFNTNKGFTIVVCDNGKGIRPDEYKAVFKKFYRSGDENTRETKGTGLGLFLVKQILISHKAKIRAEANKPTGTKFIITFK